MDNEVTDNTPYALYIQLTTLKAGWPAQDDPHSVVLGCGWQAIELLCGLVAESSNDSRRWIAAERIERYVEIILAGLTEICRPLQDQPLPPQLHADQPPARPSPGLSVLDRLPVPLRRRLFASMCVQLESLPFLVGVEAQIGASVGTPADGRPTLDYRHLVRPERLRMLAPTNPFGPEDHLFRAVHQITECWLAIVHHHLAQARHWAKANDWSAAALSVSAAAGLLSVATGTARLLDLMVLADYHPLRVRLRDGSGAQSQAAQRLRGAATDAFASLNEHLDSRGLTLTYLLDNPRRLPGLHRYLAAVQDYARRCQTFLFEHYLLALTVLGNDNLGSLGYAIRMLGERALEPVLVRLDQAKHDYTLVTNLRHGRHSGSVILARELAIRPTLGAADHDDCATALNVPPPDLVRQRVARYFRAIEDRDAAEWVELFAIGAVFRDSVTSRPFHGRRQLRVFIDSMLATFSTMAGTIGEVDVNGSHAQVPWSFTASTTGVEVDFSGTETFRFSSSGLILAAEVHWRPHVLAAQIWRKLQACREEPSLKSALFDRAATDVPKMVHTVPVSLPVCA